MSVGEDMEKLKPSYTAGENVKFCSCSENNLAETQKVKWSYYTTRPLHSWREMRAHRKARIETLVVMISATAQCAKNPNVHQLVSRQTKSGIVTECNTFL
jgi:hypothetical protein